MASSINASTTAGVVTTADTSGVLNIQTAGTTAISISAAQAVSVAGTLSATGAVSFTSANPSLSLGNGNASAGSLRFNPWTATNYNWLIDNGVITAGSLSITPSTAVGGNTYTTPVAAFSTTGLAVAGTLSATTSVAGNSNVLSLINSNTAGGGQGVAVSGFSSNGSNSLGSIQFGGAGSLGGNLDFYTANSSGTNTLNMRLGSDGNLLVGTTSAYASGATPHLFVSANTSGKYVGVFKNANATPGCLALDLSADPNNSSDTFIATIQNRFKVLSNGNVQNTNNSYGAISDVKLKENIVDATPKLAGLMQVKVRNYNLIGETTKQIGVVAQELETVFPAMVDESLDKDAEGNDLGTTTKSVKYSVFVPMLIKAIQEQQALIIQLQADVAALKGA